jgi:protein involved in polysaccharide export with SLBB domain
LSHAQAHHPLGGFRPALRGDSLPQGSASRPAATWIANRSRPRPVPTATFADIGYADWSDQEPDYRFYPGDEVEVSVPSAAELNKSVVVQPDGRVALPLVAPVMAADRTISELEASITQAYRASCCGRRCRCRSRRRRR